MVKSSASLLPLEDARQELVDRLLSAPVVPARAGERKAAAPLIDAFIDGLGENAATLLSAYMDRAAGRLITLVNAEYGRFASKVTYDHIVEVMQFNKVRLARPTTTQNKAGKFERGAGYTYAKSLSAEDWFDSGTERDLANVIDATDEVSFWLRLQRNDPPILWAEGRDYNPDFVVVQDDDCHYLVEVKRQKEMTSTDVQSKRKAARRCANHVNKSAKVKAPWAYLLVGEEDVKTASGSCAALKKLAS